MFESLKTTLRKEMTEVSSSNVVENTDEWSEKYRQVYSFDELVVLVLLVRLVHSYESLYDGIDDN